MNRTFHLCSILFLSIFFVTTAFADDNPTLKFLRSGTEVKEITLRQLLQSIKPYTQRIYDPRYRKEKTYNCLPINKVVELAFGEKWWNRDETVAVLTASDGYASVSDAIKLTENGGCLAYADAEYPNWEPVPPKGKNPAPYYLNWSDPKQSTENDYPWPYQLLSINLVKFEERYPQVVPAGVEKNSPAFRGYMIFRNRCMRCHSINQEGGKVGPDLNAPRSIVTYRDKATLLQYIHQPSKFRYTEMPDHKDLSDKDLEDIYQYFTVKSKQPEKQAF